MNALIVAERDALQFLAIERTSPRGFLELRRMVRARVQSVEVAANERRGIARSRPKRFQAGDRHSSAAKDRLTRQPIAWDRGGRFDHDLEPRRRFRSNETTRAFKGRRGRFASPFRLCAGRQEFGCLFGDVGDDQEPSRVVEDRDRFALIHMIADALLNLMNSARQGARRTLSAHNVAIASFSLTAVQRSTFHFSTTPSLLETTARWKRSSLVKKPTNSISRDSSR